MSEDVYVNPMTTLYAAIAAKAKGEPVDEDAVQEAAMIVAAAQLMKAGISEEAVLRQFNERDYSIRLVYEGKTRELQVVVDWKDDVPLRDESDD